MRFLVYFLLFLNGSLFAAPFAWVASANTGGNPGSISIIDTATNIVTSTIAVAKFAQQITITPNGSFAYLNVEVGSSFVDIVVSTATQIITATITPAATVNYTAISPNGSFAYLSTGVSGNVTVYNALNYAQAASISVPGGFGVTYLAFTPNGSFVWALEGVGQYSVIQTSNNQVTNTVTGFPTGNGAVAFSPNGSFAYMVNSTGSVFIIQTSNLTVAGTITVGVNPQAILMAPSGAFAYVLNVPGGASSVSVINTASNLVTATIPLASTGAALYPAITPNGSFLYIPINNSQTGTIANVINTGTLTVSATVTVGLSATSAAITPTPLVGSAAPLVTAVQLRNFFPFQTDLYTVVGWTTAGTTATFLSFSIYRDAGLTMLAATLSGNTLRFEDHDLTAGQTYNYFIVGNTSVSSQISLGSASITIVP